ncbi:hypothetical protein NMT12_30162 [metagenome]
MMCNFVLNEFVPSLCVTAVTRGFGDINFEMLEIIKHNFCINLETIFFN